VPLHCPACGKTNDAETSPTCARCGCDLGMLQAIRACAAWHLASAAEQMQRRDWHEAIVHAERSWHLRKSAAAARMAFLALAAMGDTRNATAWHAISGDLSLPS